MRAFPRFQTKDGVVLDLPTSGRDALKTIFTPFEVKEINVEGRTFEGLAAAWSQDLGGDLIEPGAFKKTLADWRRSKKKSIKLLDSHQGFGTVKAAIGGLEEAAETEDGLFIKAWTLPDDPDADAVLRRIKAGLVDGLSIGYRPIVVKAPTPEQERAGVFRILKEVQLKEISVVLFPMNENARIDLGSVKHMLDVAKGRALTPDELDELKYVHSRIGALLSAPDHQATPPDPPAAGLAPEDPRRVELESTFRDLTFRTTLGAA